MNAVSLAGFATLWFTAVARRGGGVPDASPALAWSDLWHVPAPHAAALAAWAGTMSFSRVYLGNHSVADVCAGAAAGATVLAGFAACEPHLLAWAAATPALEVLAVGLAAARLALLAHPERAPRRTYGESCCMLGVAVGTLAGVAALRGAVPFAAAQGFAGRLGAASSAAPRATVAWAGLARAALMTPVLFAILAAGKVVIGVPLALAARALDVAFVPYGALERKGTAAQAATDASSSSSSAATTTPAGLGGSGGAGANVKAGGGSRDTVRPAGPRIDTASRILTYALMTFVAVYVLPTHCPAVLRG
jgi:hypothetical protein